MLSTSLRGVISQQLLQQGGQERPRRGARDPGQHAGGCQPDPPGQARPARERPCSRAARTACAPWTARSRQLLEPAHDHGQRGLQEGHQQGASSSQSKIKSEPRRVRPSFCDFRALPDRGSHASQDSRHERAALRQRPAAPRPHHRERADRHLGALPAHAGPRLHLRVRRGHARHAGHAQGAGRKASRPRS